MKIYEYMAKEILQRNGIPVPMWAVSVKRMGHAGAIIERGNGTFESKVEALTAAL